MRFAKVHASRILAIASIHLGHPSLPFLLCRVPNIQSAQFSASSAGPRHGGTGRTDKHSLARAVRGHAPPGKFSKFDPPKWLEMHYKLFKCHFGSISTRKKDPHDGRETEKFPRYDPPKGCQLLKDSPPQAFNFRKVTAPAKLPPPPPPPLMWIRNGTEEIEKWVNRSRSAIMTRPHMAEPKHFF